MEIPKAKVSQSTVRQHILYKMIYCRKTSQPWYESCYIIGSYLWQVGNGPEQPQIHNYEETFSKLQNQQLFQWTC